jgi:hypothetical protein
MEMTVAMTKAMRDLNVMYLKTLNA